MELLFVMLFGLAIGTAARYLVPQRDTHGIAVVPAVGGIAAGVVWLGLTWLGWAWDGGWIWVITLVASAVISTIVALALGRARATSDTKRLIALGG
ncbi:hypothetical protein [Mycetocola zhadangensis]|uniref:GlsB/YeaQ/YmgE family stress response membrane protein n=1 Tax=Mycetocola zhadangensis TaxID=1164595 RepID=A0A3L7J5C9_9MICO|nr:hypothetical protein [Mycetocola zhadangensis]RLQ85734.1 hypothetical protein D9V28_02370 [Mycetocola zhadangensis]GGE85317.1 hypothetical protein GCM10011313_04690 [Mycetocola zhadangensis]